MTLTQPVHALLDSLRSAAIYDLEQPRHADAPTFKAHQPGFVYRLHRRHEPDMGEARTSASGIIITAEHSGTHIDALCHIAENMHLHGGRRVNPQIQTFTGFKELGVEAIPPMLARGILIDVARHRGVDRLPPAVAVSADELRAAAEAQGVSAAPGDVVLVRTGNGSQWHDPEEYLRGPGMSPEASEWLAGLDALAVGADNVAWDATEVVDANRGNLPGHVILLVRSGIYILENLFRGTLSQWAERVPLPLLPTEDGWSDRIAGPSCRHHSDVRQAGWP